MAGLLYREDMDAVRERLTCWWHGGSIGRPVIHLQVPREPVLDITPEPIPEGWVTDYSTSNFEFRKYLAKISCNSTYFLGESVPFTSPDLGPGCLSLYLGCQGVEEPGTVWMRPCMAAREDARFDVDPKNFYWDFSLRLAHAMREIGKGKFMLQCPDLLEGLDTLSAMRGNQTLLTDLLLDPQWAHRCLRQITDRYFYYYDVFYDLMRDEVGGSYFWIWAPGRMAKFQCDFAAMIGKEMFDEFMAPVLREMCERVSYSMFHWDGPGALPHLDTLLSIERLGIIQWVPGAGQLGPDDPKWWPLYHRMLESGKSPFIYHCVGEESLLAMKKEFGAKFERFFLGMYAPDIATAQRWLKAAES